MEFKVWPTTRHHLQPAIYQRDAMGAVIRYVACNKVAVVYREFRIESIGNLGDDDIEVLQKVVDEPLGSPL